MSSDRIQDALGKIEDNEIAKAKAIEKCKKDIEEWHEQHKSPSPDLETFVASKEFKNILSLLRCSSRGIVISKRSGSYTNYEDCGDHGISNYCDVTYRYDYTYFLTEEGFVRKDNEKGNIVTVSFNRVLQIWSGQCKHIACCNRVKEEEEINGWNPMTRAAMDADRTKEYRKDGFIYRLAEELEQLEMLPYLGRVYEPRIRSKDFYENWSHLEEMAGCSPVVLWPDYTPNIVDYICWKAELIAQEMLDK